MVKVTYISTDGKQKVVLVDSDQAFEELVALTNHPNVEVVPLPNSDYGTTYDHGNARNHVAMSNVLRTADEVGKEFRDGEAAMYWAAFHVDGLPARGYLEVKLTGTLGSSTFYIHDAARQPTALPSYNGKALQFNYAFNCGKISKDKP